MNPREVLEGLFRAWRDGDAHRATAYFAADASYREARHEPLAGRAAILAHFVRFFRDGPRFEFNVEELIVDGERAAVAYRFAVESFGAVWMEKPGCALVRFSDGAIVDWREYDG